MKRRDFLKTTALVGAGALTAANELLSAPLIFTRSRILRDTSKGEIIFQPYFVQKGSGPHMYELAWATDKNWDTFYSDISIKSGKGISISDTKGEDKFGINCRWNVEGFGYTNITADNGGEFYALPANGKEQKFNLNYELAKSRVIRNRSRLKRLMSEGLTPSTELNGLKELSEELFEDASKKISNAETCAELAQESLNYALWAGEKMELEKADYAIKKRGYRPEFFMGCDARAFFQMYQDDFLKYFSELFNYANVTFVAKGDGLMSDYQPQKGVINPDTREVLIKKLNERNIKCQERLLFWFHDCCIPQWMRDMKYDELLKYAEKITTETMKIFGDSLYAMEVLNELHDWANELNLNHEQITELASLINDTSKSIAPNVKTTINSAAFAEYIQMNQYSSGNKAKYKQRTPWQWAKDLTDAGVNIDIIELQMYYPYRDLQDSILMTERFEVFKKPMHYSEVGVSGGPTERSVKLGTVKFPKEPYLWHHQWDEETQADWLESIYKLAYSKEYIKACNWFDLVDPYSYMDNGGLLRNPEGEKKESYLRLQKLQQEWKNL